MSDFGTCPAYGTQCEYVAKAEAPAEAVTQAADDERAKIVAWLRGETGCAWSRDVIEACDAIEAGEHLK